MTINKISRSGTSVVTLAELQSGSAVFVQKVSRVATTGPVITGGLVSQADIIKRGVQVQTIVGRALANPYGSVFNFFDRLGLSDEAILLLARQVALADQFFITHNTPQFLLNKGLSDIEPILDRISLRIAAFRVFEDAQFVSSATKFTLNRPLADDQSLIDFTRLSAGYQRAAADIQTIVDTRLAITIGKANQDTVTQSDSNARNITALKQDQIIPTEDKALTVGKGLSDGVRIRNRDDPGPALFVTKLLRDATTILDLTGIFDGLTYQNIMYRFDTVSMSDDFARTITADRRFNDDQSVIEKIFLQRGVNYQDTATPADNKQLAITVQRSDDTVITEALQRAFLAQRVFQDTEIISEVKALTTGLGKTDVAAMLERLVNAVSKANTDTAIVTENIGKSSIKELTDSIISSEAIAKLINKGLTDEVTIIEDILILLINFIRVNADSVDALNAHPIFSVGKQLTDTTVNLDQNYKDIGKAAEDNFSTIDNRPVFAVSKYLADIASMSDLAAAFDGITYNYGLGRLDAAQATDEFIRQFTAFRTLEEQVSITDVVATARGIGFAARTDTATVTDTIIRGTLKFETLFIGSGQDQRSRAEERTSFNFTLPITTNYRTQIDDVNFFAGVQENFVGIVAGQTFAGSIMFASTSAGASVQVTSTGTGAGTAGGFATVYGNPYISFNGAGNRTVATVPIDFTAITSVSITFAYIAGNNGNGGEQPDLNEDLIIEYSIDDSTTFVTAATIAAISTYGSVGWSQYTSSLPTAAKTSSTILRWRQTKQSISTGDNWGITNIQLGGTSFGTFVRTYYDNNTASIVDRLSLGRFQTVGPDFVYFWQPPVSISSNLTYVTSAVFITSAFGTAFNIQDVVYSQYSGRWIATQNQLNSPGKYFWSTTATNWVSANTVTIYPDRYLATDASGVVVVMTGSTSGNPNQANEYSADGGVSWQQANATVGVGAPTSGAYKPVYLANAATPTFIYPYTASSANGVCFFMFASGTATVVGGSRWTRGANFPGIFEGGVNGTSNTLKIRGAANGSGTTVVYLTNYFNFGALYTLSDATTLNASAAFTLTTSLSANRTLFNSGASVWNFNNHQQQLAFGNGRFVWISTNGNLLTTTSPTVSASWQSFSLETISQSFTTGGVTYGNHAGAIHQHLIFDRVQKQFIIYRYGTSLTTAGFWISNTGAPSDWSFRSLSSVGYTVDITYPDSPSSKFFDVNKQQLLFPSTIASYTTGNTSIGRLLIVNGNEGYGFWRAQYPMVFGSLGEYFEPENPWPRDRVTFGYGIGAKQGVNRTFSSQTTTAYDTERIYAGSQAALTSGFVGYSSVLASTSTITPPGNIMLWSENLQTSLYTSLGAAYIEVVPDQAFAPDGTWTADKVIVKSVGNAYLQQSVHPKLNTSTTYTFSFAARVEDGSSSIGKRMVFEHFDNYWGINFSTSVVLTQFWTRYSATFTTQIGTPSVSRINMFFSNGGNTLVTSAEVLTQNEYVYLWGLSLTTGGTTAARIGYTRTTGTTLLSPGGTQTIDNYTTSNLYSSSIGWRYPLYFVGTLVSSTPVQIYTTSVGAYAFQTPIRTWDDTQEKVSFLIGQNPQEFLTADETTRFLLTGARRFNETANIADNRAFSITMPAYRGVAGQVQLKTINAAGNQAQSSVLFSYGARSPDVVGTIDLIFVAIIKTSTFADTISIGSGIDQRQSTTERISFAITKANTDTVSISDQSVNSVVFNKINRDTAVVTERPVFDVAISKTDTVTADDVLITTRGKGLIEIVTVVDNLTQSISLLKADNQDVTENRIFDVAVSKADNITQQSLIALTAIKSVNDTVLEDDQLSKLIDLNKVDVLDAVDRNNFDVALTAYRGVAGTVTLNTIDPSPDVEFEQSSVTVIRGARSPDEVGMLDLFSLIYIINRQIEDAIAATDERTFFTITKTFADSFVPDDFLTTFDGLTYAGFMLRQDSIDAAHRMFMDVVLGARTELASIADLTAIAQGKLNTDTIGIGTDAGFRNTNSLETTNFNVTKLAGNLVVTTSDTSSAIGGSATFNGSTQYLDISSTSAFGFGTADFTIEFWWRPTVNQRSDVLDFWSTAGGSITGRFDIGRITGSTLDLYTDSPVGGGSSGAKITGPTIASLLNTWVHVAVTRQSGSIRLWVNGTQAGNTYTAWVLNMGSSMALRIMGDHNASGNGSGNLSNVRVVTGTAIYTSSFTPPNVPLTAIANTQLLLLMSTSGSATIDSSPNNLTLSAPAGVGFSSSSPASITGGSAVFNGSNTTWRIDTSSAFTYGTNDFTIEFWGNQSGVSGVQGIQRTSTGDATNSSGFCTITQSGGRLTVTQGTGTSSLVVSSISTIAINTWHHYAYVRSGTSFKLYVDGQVQGPGFTYAAAIPAQVGYMQIGNAGGLYSGRLTNFRIVNGTAVYTSDFTPPTGPLTAIANTQLLLLTTSSATIAKDDSPNNFNVYPSGGTPSFIYLTPFAAAAGSESSITTTSYTNTHPVIILDTERLLIGLNRQDNVDTLDVSRLFSTYIRGLTEVQNIDELKALSISKYNADVFALGDVLALVAINNKFQFDAVFNADAAQFAIGKFTDNTITGSDALAFNQSKTLSDSFEENDAVSQTLSLVKTDDQSLADRSNLSLTLLRSDSASLDDVASLIGAFNRSVVDDLFVTQEPVFFTITKQLSDNFVPDDFLQTFDGLTYAYATSRYDEIINSQRVYLDMVLGARTDTVVSLEQILVAQLKRYDDSVAETDQLQLRIDNLINNIAIAADVQAFSVAAIKADFIAGDERKYLDIAKFAAADTISLADLIDLILFVPTPDQFYFDTIFISDATAFDFSKDLSGLPVAVAVDVAIKFDVAIVAHRGVAGTVTLNTIDPSPDVEFAQSSVTVSRSSADNDEVGMLDFFSLTYATVRSIEDFIAITDISRLDITKLFNDSTVPDDFLQTFDGLTYATTILKQDVISIGLPGFTGPRVSGDDRERIAIDVAVAKSDAVDGTDTGLSLITGKGNSDAIDNADTLVLNVSILKTDVQIVEQTQRFFDITAVRTDEITNLDALRKDISKLLGTEDVVSVVDLLALVAQYQLSLSDIQSILAEKDGHFSYLLAQTLRNDDLSVDDDRLASFISKDLTNLDGLNNINTMVSNGTLRMTDYADIDYFAEDYVGESRSFT